MGSVVRHSRPGQLSVRERLRNRFRHIATRHRQGLEPPVFVFSVPRSGSTWVTELIASQGRFKIVNEPFNLRRPEVRDNLGIREWSDLLDTTSRPAMQTYLQDFIAGRDSDPRFKRENPGTEFWHFTTDRVIFKILFAGEDDFNWFPRTFGGRVIFLLRHPIPVSLSRTDLPRLRTFLTGPFARHFTPGQIGFAHEVLSSDDPFQMAVLDWCLQNAVPLRNLDSAWLTLSYEQLVVEPEIVIERIVDHLELPDGRAMLERATRASASTTKSDSESRSLLRAAETQPDARRRLVDRWHSKVDAARVRRTFEILAAFDIDFYTPGDVLPSSRYLLSRPRALR
jgi:hypothetical protein